MRRTALATLALAGWMVSACAHGPRKEPAYLSGRQISLVQQKLSASGHPVEATGTWTPDTRTAIASFQKERRLAASGVLDLETTRALGIDRDAIPDAVLDPDYPYVNCDVYHTVDCRPAAW